MSSTRSSTLPRAPYGLLVDGGIEIHEYRKSFLHAKVAVIDRHRAIVGSSNVDPFSLLLAREANVAIEDEKFAEELRASLVAAMQDGATRVERAELARQPVAVRLMTWLCYGLARLLTGVTGHAPKNFCNDRARNWGAGGGGASSAMRVRS